MKQPSGYFAIKDVIMTPPGCLWMLLKRMKSKPRAQIQGTNVKTQAPVYRTAID